MKIEEVQEPYIDFSSKFTLVKSYEKRCNHIFEILEEISKETTKLNKKKDSEIISKRGIIIAYGKFDRNEHKVGGLVQLAKTKQSTNSIIWIQDKDFKDFLIEKSEESDGAIIINHDGLVLGTDIYLIVTNPQVSIDEECATRHIAAMSFSEREDVIATFTLSEETSKVRMYQDGKQANVFDPTNTKTGSGL